MSISRAPLALGGNCLRRRRVEAVDMRCGVFCSLLVALAGSSWAQEPVFRTDTHLVVLHATVVDKNGQLLTDLPKSAFKVYEDGVRQELKVFRREDVPVSLGIVIDNSASMKDKRPKVASAALALVEASNRDDEVFIMTFNEHTYLEKEFTNNIKELEEGLRNIDSRGGTAMRDALLLGLEHLKHRAKKDKKVLLVITDGDDNSSQETLEHLVQTAQQNGVLIYAVGLLTEEEPHEAERCKKALDALTQASGGEAFYPKELSEVDQIARHVAHDIRNQYILAYSSSNPALDGTYRKIKVVVEGPNEPTVTTRSGYYATVGFTALPEREQMN